MTTRSSVPSRTKCVLSGLGRIHFSVRGAGGVSDARAGVGGPAAARAARRMRPATAVKGRSKGARVCRDIVWQLCYGRGKLRRYWVNDARTIQVHPNRQARPPAYTASQAEAPGHGK